jgi:hypothetical protein
VTVNVRVRAEAVLVRVFHPFFVLCCTRYERIFPLLVAGAFQVSRTARNCDVAAGERGADGTARGAGLLGVGAAIVATAVAGAADALKVATAPAAMTTDATIPATHFLTATLLLASGPPSGRVTLRAR